MTGQRFDARLLGSPYLEVQGTVTTHDHAAGATTLLVEMAGDFDDVPEQGVAYLRVRPAQVPDVDPVDPFVVGYSTWDGEEEEQEWIELTSGLPVAVPAGSLVDVWSPDPDAPTDVTLGEPVSVYEALVMPDDEDVNSDPLTVTVHPDLLDTLSDDLSALVEGVPVLVETQESYGAGENPEDEGDDTLYLTRVLGGPLVRDGGFINETTIPTPEGVVLKPTLPPAFTPSLTLRGGIGAVVLSTSAPAEQTDQVGVWLSTTTPVDTSGAATVALPALQEAPTFVRTIDGVAVTPGTTYYGIARAFNSSGPASSFSAQTSTTVAQVTGPDIAANAVTADKITANAVTADKVAANAITAAKIAGDAIDGKTITGALIRTAASGPRWQLGQGAQGNALLGLSADVTETTSGGQRVGSGDRTDLGGTRRELWIQTQSPTTSSTPTPSFVRTGVWQGIGGVIELSANLLLLSPGVRDSLIAAARADSGLVTVTPASGYTANASAPFSYRLLNGVVYLRGIISRDAGNMVAGTAYTIASVPSVARPSLNSRYPCAIGTTLGTVVVQTDGAVIVTPVTTAANNVHLSVISYPAA